MEGKKVYEAIVAITGELSKDGISKERKSQNYSFRGIDDVYNHLATLLAQYKLCIIPVLLERECTERQAKSGAALIYVTVKARFDIVSAEDGSRHEATTYGEAMDSSDKATNKAMSTAYKYMAFMTFCIPTEGDNDTENNTHEVVAKSPARKWAESKPSEFDKLKADTTELVKKLEMCESKLELESLVDNNEKLTESLRGKLPEWSTRLKDKIEQCREAFDLS